MHCFQGWMWAKGEQGRVGPHAQCRAVRSLQGRAPNWLFAECRFARSCRAVRLAIEGQAIWLKPFRFKRRVACALDEFCFVFCASLLRRRMPRKGWSTVEVPNGWLQIIGGPRLPAAQWPRAKAQSNPVQKPSSKFGRRPPVSFQPQQTESHGAPEEISCRGTCIVYDENRSHPSRNCQSGTGRH